jgi:nicotinate dehydrogenase subunit B
VESLAELPESDVRAIATYIASFNTDVPSQAVLDDSARKLRERSEAEAALHKGTGPNIFAGACAVCHTAGQGTEMFGEKLPLALNTNLHAPRPDNLIQVLMRGVSTSASSQVGAMPGFADSLSDRQMTELVEYLRRVYAPDKPAWTDVGTSVARLREAAH